MGERYYLYITNEEVIAKLTNLPKRGISHYITKLVLSDIDEPLGFNDTQKEEIRKITQEAIKETPSPETNNINRIVNAYAGNLAKSIYDSYVYMLSHYQGNLDDFSNELSNMTQSTNNSAEIVDKIIIAVKANDINSVKDICFANINASIKSFLTDENSLNHIEESIKATEAMNAAFKMLFEDGGMWETIYEENKEDPMFVFLSKFENKEKIVMDAFQPLVDMFKCLCEIGKIMYKK